MCSFVNKIKTIKKWCLDDSKSWCHIYLNCYMVEVVKNSGLGQWRHRRASDLNEKFELKNLILFENHDQFSHFWCIFRFLNHPIIPWSWKKLRKLDSKLNYWEYLNRLTDTGENEPKCAVYFRPGAESYSSFGLLNYFLWWEVNSVVALCTLWTKFTCGQVSSPRLYRLK